MTESNLLKPWDAWKLWEEGARVQYRKPVDDLARRVYDSWHDICDRTAFCDIGLEFRLKPPTRYRVKEGVDGRDTINAGYVIATVDSAESTDVRIGDDIKACVSLYLLDIDDSLIFLALRCKREGKTLADFQAALDQIEEVPE